MPNVATATRNAMTRACDDKSASPSLASPSPRRMTGTTNANAHAFFSTATRKERSLRSYAQDAWVHPLQALPFGAMPLVPLWIPPTSSVNASWLYLYRALLAIFSGMRIVNASLVFSPLYHGKQAETMDTSKRKEAVFRRSRRPKSRFQTTHAPATPRPGRAGAFSILISLLSEHSLPRARKDGFAREARPRLRGGANSLWRKRLPYGLPLWRAHPCQSREKRTLRTPEAF